jgi:hypothetical protein
LFTHFVCDSCAIAKIDELAQDLNKPVVSCGIRRNMPSNQSHIMIPPKLSEVGLRIVALERTRHLARPAAKASGSWRRFLADALVRTMLAPSAQLDVNAAVPHVLVAPVILVVPDDG